MNTESNIIYIYIDEHGDFRFNRSGSKYFILTALSTETPFAMCDAFHEVKHQLNLDGIDLEKFHATEDKQDVRDKIYSILKTYPYEVDAVIVEKAKTNPVIREPKRFYPLICGYLLQYLFRRYQDKKYDKIIVYTSKISIDATREAIIKGIKTSLAKLFNHTVPYHIYHHNSESNFYLQAIDYCCWAIYKKWGTWNGQYIDPRPFNEIKNNVKSEFEIFKMGDRTYY